MRGTSVVQQMLASAARTSSGVSSIVNVKQAEEVAVDLDVTAISGTNAKIGFALQWRDDPDSGAWYTSAEIVRTSAAGRLMKRVPTLAAYFRLAYTIVGTTPSATFAARVSWRE